jgi:CBS domain-containing protein
VVISSKVLPTARGTALSLPQSATGVHLADAIVMTVNELMTVDPVCCTPQTPLREVARLMSAHDCGEIPVVETRENRLLLGVVTDRDIVLRAVADGRNPADTPIESCMTSNVVTVRPDTTLEECCKLMEEHQIRRVPVVDGAGICCGIVSQADVAQRASAGDTGELVREVSKPGVRTH